MNRRSINAPHPRARALTVQASTPEPSTGALPGATPRLPPASSACAAAWLLRSRRRRPGPVEPVPCCAFAPPSVSPAPASVARVFATGLTVDGHTPPTVGCQTRRTECGCEEDAARPGSLRRNATSGELRRRGAAVPGCGHRTDAGVKGHSSTRVNMARRLWGSCEDAKRPACDANGRPARVEAAA